MEIELSKVFELLATLGEQGKEAFIWWLVFKYGVGPLTFLAAFSGVVLMVVWVVAPIWKGNTTASVAMRELRGLLNTGSSGRLTEYEADSIVEEVRRLKREKNG